MMTRSIRFSVLAFAFVFLCLSLPALRAAEAAIDIGGARFFLPSDWAPAAAERVSPARAGEWTFGQGGEAAAFFFGTGKGGDIQANMATLARRMTTATGGPAPLVNEGSFVRKASEGPLKATWLVCYGVYTGDPLRSGIPALPRAGWGLIGFAAEFPGGPVYFRITGPEETIRALLPRLTREGGLFRPVLAAAAASAAVPAVPAPAASGKKK